jgi:ABC-type ATPase with predicted acetyltransferase domain
MQLIIEHTVSAAMDVRPSDRVMELASMFGIGIDEEQPVPIVPRCEIPIPERGGVVFITGPSGSGKSTIIRLIADQCRRRGVIVLMLDQLSAPQDPTQHRELPLIDSIGESLDEAVALLSLAGLGDAFVMLRTPSQLSDGQRARFRMAKAMEWAGASAARVIIADEFAATLDRLTARTLARSIRRWISRTHHVFIAATTHDDLLEPLQPDVLVYKGLGDQVEVCVR